MSLTQRRVKQLTISLLSLTLLFNLNFPTFAAPGPQDSSFDFRTASDGFYGSYRVGGAEYLYSVSQKRQMQESRIQRESGKDIASCVLNKDKVTVIFAGVSITFDLTAQTMSPLDASEATALRDFGSGSDAVIARDVISNIVTRSNNVTAMQLFGMVVMGMILGDANGEARNLLPNAPQNSAKQVALSQLVRAEMAHAFETSPRKAEMVRACKRAAIMAKTKGKRGRAPKPVAGCFGCCGAGCWGCTGVYTPECAAHDACVSQNGYWDPRCLALLAVAIHSYHQVICALCT